MREELEDALFKDFPILYKNHQRCFECGDGWFTILRTFSERVEPLVLQFSEKEREDFKVACVKEKFGTIRIDCDYPYCSDHWLVARMLAFENEAEVQSRVTCEECGGPGTMRTPKGWVHVHCDECEAGREAKRKADWAAYNAKKNIVPT